MLLVLAGYATRPPFEDKILALLKLHHLLLTLSNNGEENDGKEIHNAIALAKLAIRCGWKMMAVGSTLGALLQQGGGQGGEQQAHCKDAADLLVQRLQGEEDLMHAVLKNVQNTQKKRADKTGVPAVSCGQTRQVSVLCLANMLTQGFQKQDHVDKPHGQKICKKQDHVANTTLIKDIPM
jgi:hypothetical protein